MLGPEAQGSIKAGGPRSRSEHQGTTMNMLERASGV